MEYAIVAVIMVVLIGVVAIVGKKQTEKLNEMLGNVTDEQKARLMQNEVQGLGEAEWTQIGMIGMATDKGDSVALKIIWYNTVINNNTMNDFQYGDLKISKEEFSSHGLGVGSIVRVYIAPNKTVGSFKIIF